MPVVTAANLRKELAGSLLFEGVSFSVERRDRLALSGPNGAGKTTLLRMLVGESEVHGGELSFAKGTRIALHDQRPPLDRGLTLREYSLTGARDLIETEEELRTLEQAMAAGDHRRRRWAGTRQRRPGSSTQAATRGATARLRRCAAWASPSTTSTGRWRPSPAASSRVPRSPERSPAIPTCCCWMSRRTTSTSRTSSGSSRSCSRSTRR